MPSLTLVQSDKHTTLTWSETSPEIQQQMQKLLDKGHNFLVLAPNKLGDFILKPKSHHPLPADWVHLSNQVGVALTAKTLPELRYITRKMDAILGSDTAVIL